MLSSVGHAYSWRFLPACHEYSWCFLPLQVAINESVINGESENDGISIEGHRQPTPPPSPLTQAPCRVNSEAGGGGEGGAMISSEELDKQLRENVESRALEW